MYVGENQRSCLPCAAKAKGMGNIDLSQFTWSDWALVAGVVVALVAIDPMKLKPKPRVKRRRKPVSGSAGFAGGLVTAALLAGGGYLAYQLIKPASLSTVNE